MAHDALHVLFWSKVNKEAPGGCWLWQGQLFDDDGILGWRGEIKRVHNFSWELHQGEVPTAKVGHTCGKGLCVNPKHLRLEVLVPTQKRRGRPPKEAHVG